MSPHHHGPTGAGVFRLALLVVVIVLVLQVVAATQRGQSADAQDRGSFCDQHRGQPAWTSVCKEETRGR